MFGPEIKGFHGNLAPITPLVINKHVFRTPLLYIPSVAFLVCSIFIKVACRVQAEFGFRMEAKDRVPRGHVREESMEK